MGKELFRVAATALGLVSGILYMIILNSDHWVTTNASSRNQGLEMFKDTAHGGIFWGCTKKANGYDECETTPVQRNGQYINHLAEGEGMYIMLKVFAFFSVALTVFGTTAALAAQDSIKLASPGSKNKACLGAGVLFFLAAALVITVGAVFYSNATGGINTYLKMSTGCYISWVVGLLLVVSSILSFIGREEREEYVEGTEMHSNYKAGQDYHQDYMPQQSNQGSYI